MPLADSEKRILLAALGLIPVESAKPHVKAVITRAHKIVRAIPWRSRNQHEPAGQISLPLEFKKLPPSIKRNKRKRWAKYPFQYVEEARIMRANGYTYREIAACINATHGVNVNWITVRDWTSQYYRLTG